MNLRQVIIFAKDMDRMTAFYRDGLGLREIPESRLEGWVELEAGGSVVALHVIPEAIARDIEITDPPHRRSNTPIKLVFEAPELETARAHLVAQGAVMFELRRGGASCDGLDPEGNVFQVMKVGR